jgi:glutathione S-transferase
MSRVKLYGTRFSPFVEKVARGFELKRVAFDLIGPRSPGDLRRWSPQTRKMPVAEIDGERIFDSTFILRRLDEISPRPPLLSDDPAVASAQRLLEDWADESLYWLRMAILWNDRNAATTTEALISDLAPPSLFRPLMRPVLLRGMRRSTQAQGFGRLPADVLERELCARIFDLATQLGDRPFFYADRPGIADLAVYGQLSFVGAAPPSEFVRALDEQPRLRDWQKDLEQATGG